jgi:hypothetical protein
MNRRATSRDLSRFKGQPSLPVGEDGDASLVGFCVTQSVDGSPVCMDVVGGDFDFGNAPEGEQKLYQVPGWLFRSLFQNVANSVGDRSLEHYALGLQASKVHTHELAGLDMTPARRSSSCETSNASRFRWVAASAGAHGGIRTCISISAKSTRASWV